MNMNVNTKTRDLALIPVFSVLTSVCTWIMIPGPVPFTMQTFAVFLSLLLLGGKRGTAAVLVYLLLGFAGLPVFSGFSAGPGVLLGPTGGYLIGFIAIGLLFAVCVRIFGGSDRVKAASLIAGLLVCYLFGTLWFTLGYNSGSGSVTFTAALGLCVLPFVVPDLLKLGLAFWVAKQIRKRRGQ
jgi:biotin transport system substrate-specific component